MSPRLSIPESKTRSQSFPKGRAMRSVPSARLGQMQHRADTSQTVQRLGALGAQAGGTVQRQVDLAATVAPQLTTGFLPHLMPAPAAAPDAPPVQGLFFVPIVGVIAGAIVREFAKGAAQGVAIEAAKDGAMSKIDTVIAGAGPAIDKAINAALQNAELKEQLQRIVDLSGITRAATDFASLHAGEIAAAIRTQLSEVLPEMPGLPDLSDWIPTFVTQIKARVQEKIEASFLYGAYQIGKETASTVLSAVALSALTQKTSEFIRSYAVNLGGEMVKETAKAAAEPAIETLKGQAEQIHDLAENIPDIGWRNPAKYLGKKVGQAGYRTVVGPAAKLSDKTELLETAGKSAVESAKGKAEAQIAEGGEAGADFGVLLKRALIVKQIAEGVHTYAEAEKTEDQLKAVGNTALALSLPTLAGYGTAYLLPGAAAGAFAPALCTAGLLAGGGFLGYKAISAGANHIGPTLDWAGDTTLGTPLKKGGQLTHLMASVANIPLVYATAPLPFLGGGWKAVDKAHATLLRNFYLLMGYPPPVIEVEAAEPAEDQLQPPPGREPGDDTHRPDPPPPPPSASMAVLSGPRATGLFYKPNLYPMGHPYSVVYSPGLLQTLARLQGSGMRPPLSGTAESEEASKQPTASTPEPEAQTAKDGPADPMLISYVESVERILAQPKAPISTIFPAIALLGSLGQMPRTPEATGSAPSTSELLARLEKAKPKQSKPMATLRTTDTLFAAHLLAKYGSGNLIPELLDPKIAASASVSSDRM